ncbi:hypothetical protein C0J52_18715 [Blattella germanica]|nr:hypothetical protein C0J52_18715 [Blattella germanica]
MDLIVEEEPREQRQFVGWPGVLPVGPCFTSKGVLGRCTSFRQCYPYFKLPELSNWETWILGMYDTCSYFTSSGQKPPEQPAVPSPNPIPPNWPPPIPTHPPDHTIPPLPTHPPSPGWPGLPGSTETPSTTTEVPRPPPPAPPVPPVAPPAPWPPQPWPPVVPTQPTTKPPTAKPPTIMPWPPTQPPIPTHPPYPGVPTHPPSAGIPSPTTESSPPSVVADASCGAKNGFDDQNRIVGEKSIDVHSMSSWDVARLTVRLGDYNIKINNEVRHIEKKVKRVVRHRGFDSRTLYNDVAILTMDSPVTFTHKIRPICLPSGNALYAGLTATVIGWGSLREGGQQPPVLQEVYIPIWTNNECRAKYGNAAPGGIVEHFLCAGGPGHDSCSVYPAQPVSNIRDRLQIFNLNKRKLDVKLFHLLFIFLEDLSIQMPENNEHKHTK